VTAESAAFSSNGRAHRRLRATSSRGRCPCCAGWTESSPLATPDTAPLVALLAASAERLRWAQTYTRDDFEPRFLDRYGWSELIGLRGPVASDRIAVGFLLLGPDVEYPPHHHAAEEVYYPLAGRALWQRGDERFVVRAPGECIHHAPRTPHAMKTGSEPLLALYAWRGGDLAEKSTLSRQASKR
jgi:mannose-6-phosphate isomerase-like protein (cupin superfamily)